MKVAVVSEKLDNDLANGVDAFRKICGESSFIEIGDLALLIEENKSGVFLEEKDFEEFDAVYLKAAPSFTQFVEPFLDELVEKGIYCQFKPESFYILSNKPFLYATLNSKGVNISHTVVVSDAKQLEGLTSGFSYPVIMKTFNGLNKTQNLVIDSERSLKSVIKSSNPKIDAITVQHYLEGDLFQSVVVGENVFTVKRTWNEEKLEHAKKGVSTKLPEEEKELAIKAAKVVGADVVQVKTIEGTVIGLNPVVNISSYSGILGTDLFEETAKMFREKIGGTGK